MTDSTPSCRVAIIASRYNASVTDRLLAGALESLRRRQPEAPEPGVFSAAGAFELPALAAAAARSGRYDGVVCLGCVIKGETSHDVYIATAIANALAALPAQFGVPVAFGVLTVDSPEQALARAGGRQGNKGSEAMEALLDTIDTLHAIGSGDDSSSVASKPDKATT